MLLFRHLRGLQLAWLASFILGVPLYAQPPDLPRLSTRVSDFAAVLRFEYTADLNRRLARFDHNTGYAIYIVLTERDYNQSLAAVASELFGRNEAGKSWSSGAVLVLISTQKGNAGVATSENLRSKFEKLRVESKIQNIVKRRTVNPAITMEYIVEKALHAVLAGIDPWFYVLDPSMVPMDYLVRLPTAEMVLLPLAPFLGVMTGIILMVFTRVGNFAWFGRLFVSGFLGCVFVIAAVWLIRQPGGISPGIFYYGVVIGSTMSAAIGVSRPFWFTSDFKGRKPGEPGPLYFRLG